MIGFREPNFKHRQNLFELKEELKKKYSKIDDFNSLNLMVMKVFVLCFLLSNFEMFASLEFL